MSSKSLSSLFYDFDNVGEFSNLFEHEKMLADFVRVDTYVAAISWHIKPVPVPRSMTISPEVTSECAPDASFLP